MLGIGLIAVHQSAHDVHEVFTLAGSELGCVLGQFAHESLQVQVIGFGIQHFMVLACWSGGHQAGSMTKPLPSARLLYWAYLSDKS
jgi:hypothetical protein